jgi:hypothetical protein
MTPGDIVVFTYKTNPEACGSLGVVRRVDDIRESVDVDWLLPTPQVAKMMLNGPVRDWAGRSWRFDAFEVIGHV